MEELDAVEVVVRPALALTVPDVLSADGYVLGTPANFGYMSGALKHALDTVYYPCVDATAGRPWGLWVHGNDDVEGAVGSVRRIVAIDGPGGTLGMAGPCLTRAGGGLPAFGAMQFDTADVAALQASGQLNAVILHEMGHVLGIGTLWGGLLSAAGTPSTSFTGLAARGSWNAIVGGSTPSVPVENTGGPGTADSHWRESVFGNELMTGFLNAGSNPLSAVTIGSLADLGYGVDLAAADPFGIVALRAPDTPSVHLHSDLLRPVGTVG